jgi:hypothetical protein
MDQVQIKANVAPLAMDDAFAVAEDTSLNEPAPGVLGNDSDGTSDPLTALLNTDVSNGTLTLNPNGSFTYTPATDFHGTDSFTYRANDGYRQLDQPGHGDHHGRRGRRSAGGGQRCGDDERRRARHDHRRLGQRHRSRRRREDDHGGAKPLGQWRHGADRQRRRGLDVSAGGRYL